MRQAVRAIFVFERLEGGTMKCSNCGTENEEGYKFCGKCGTPLTNPTQLTENLDRKTEEWEYLTLFLDADTATMEKELKQRFPKQRISRFSLLALMPQLNEYGKEGWELIACHPYTIGDNGDVLTHAFTQMGTMAGRQFTHTYLCVFKRRVPV